MQCTMRVRACFVLEGDSACRSISNVIRSRTKEVDWWNTSSIGKVYSTAAKSVKRERFCGCFRLRGTDRLHKRIGFDAPNGLLISNDH